MLKGVHLYELWLIGVVPTERLELVVTLEAQLIVIVHNLVALDQ